MSFHILEEALFLFFLVFHFLVHILFLRIQSLAQLLIYPQFYLLSDLDQLLVRKQAVPIGK